MKEYGTVEEWVEVKKLNTYGIGGKAHYMIKPDNQEKLIKLMQYLRKENINWYILGKGSNVICPEEDFDGAIILLDHLNQYSIKNNIVSVEAGISLSKFGQLLLDAGYINFTPLIGIPGTVGAAIIGNVGANKKEVFDDLIEVTFLDEDLTLKTYSKEKITHEYRSSMFKNTKKIILEAKFALEKGSVEKAKEKVREYRLQRQEKQPLGTKNAGSVFKNPEGISAGRLIDEVGLKGKSYGGAQVSEKHANFIINVASATSNDIIELIELIKKEVKDQKNIDLELEQIIVKW